jgi:hypothetical protein
LRPALTAHSQAPEIKRVKKGRAILIPASKDTIGHGTHTKAAV